MADTLYIAASQDRLLSCDTDALCMIVAYDDPAAAIARYHYASISDHNGDHNGNTMEASSAAFQCTLFVIRGLGGFTRDPITPSKYVYIGRGARVEIVQQITLSPDNYLRDWLMMNTIVNYTI